MTDTERVLLPGGHVTMPIIGLGTYALWGDEGVRSVQVALDAGYRHIDTATMYGNESEIGRALADTDVPREDVFGFELSADEMAHLDALRPRKST